MRRYASLAVLVAAAAASLATSPATVSIDGRSPPREFVLDTGTPSIRLFFDVRPNAAAADLDRTGAELTYHATVTATAEETTNLPVLSLRVRRTSESESGKAASLTEVTADAPATVAASATVASSPGAVESFVVELSRMDSEPTGRVRATLETAGSLRWYDTRELPPAAALEVTEGVEP